MAQLQYDELSDDSVQGLPNLGQMVNAAGAVVSLGLIAGLAWWGYQLVVRDVSGVPVVRALEGPMRTAPEDPGGELAAHTGLAVNNIPAEGIAEEPAERLVLAPETGLLAEEDKPAAVLATIDEPAPTALTEEADATPDGAATQPPARMEDSIEEALALATAEPTPEEELALAVIPADVPGLTKSLVPIARPATARAAATTPRDTDGVLSLAPGNIAVGTRLAQLGAFDTAEIAKSEWARLSRIYPEYMTDKARVIEEAQSGGKVFYRLRAHGFEGLADARRFCSALLADDINCIPVRQR